MLYLCISTVFCLSLTCIHIVSCKWGQASRRKTRPFKKWYFPEFLYLYVLWLGRRNNSKSDDDDRFLKTAISRKTSCCNWTLFRILSPKHRMIGLRVFTFLCVAAQSDVWTEHVFSLVFIKLVFWNKKVCFAFAALVYMTAYFVRNAHFIYCKQS